MSASQQTPVLVGVGACSQRLDDPAGALEPVALMARALEQAEEDAGARNLLSRADSIRVPRGFWQYPDPGRLVADSLGASAARTQVAEVGVLQSTLLGQAARDIALGKARIVLVAGGEAKYRALRAQITGRPAPMTDLPQAEADEVLRPHGEILHPLEIQGGAVMPVRQYAMLENALRASQGTTLEAHRDQIARLWAAMSEVARDNPDAWSRMPVSADRIRNAGAGNPMLAFPYTKLHNSQWNVDQAAGLILCSTETARLAGISEQRWIHPWINTESNHMLAFSERSSTHACPGFAIAGRRAFELTGTEPAQIGHRELYSCFPSAVRVQLRELGIDPEAQLTETGGMRFAGGPLNNFVLQATVRMARVLRADAGSLGLVTAVSGVLTKQGVMLYGTERAPDGFRFEDVSAEVARVSQRIPLQANLRGAARIVAYTVLYEEDVPSQAMVLCENDDRQRGLATGNDRELARAMTEEEFCGRTVQLSNGVLE